MFNRVTINTVQKIRLKFYNNSLIPVDVNCRVEQEIVFGIEPQKLNIESYACGYFWLFFSPKVIQVCFKITSERFMVSYSVPILFRTIFLSCQFVDCR